MMKLNLFCLVLLVLLVSHTEGRSLKAKKCTFSSENQMQDCFQKLIVPHMLNFHTLFVR